MRNNLNDLIRRGEVINEKVWEANYPAVSPGIFSKIVQYLDIVLPDDFLAITTHISYECSPLFQFFILDVDADDWSGIIKNNFEIRKQYIKDSEGKSDMSHILVLADDDGGSVFMITQDSRDMYYYSIHKKFRNTHDEWPSFTAFFEYLVEQEEQKLKEDLS